MLTAQLRALVIAVRLISIICPSISATYTVFRKDSLISSIIFRNNGLVYTDFDKIAANVGHTVREK